MSAQRRSEGRRYRRRCTLDIPLRVVDKHALLASMAAGGVGDVQVAARTGLETPYLSERWFELIGLILAESQGHGLAVWLADEYPYPSGTSAICLGDLLPTRYHLDHVCVPAVDDFPLRSNEWNSHAPRSSEYG